MKQPKLRFPEFDEDWEELILGSISEKKVRKNKDEKIKNVFTNSASQGILNQRDYFDKDIANQNNLSNYYIVEKDDFIYNPRISNLAPVGPISRNHLGTGVMSPLYSVFKIAKGNLDFFEFYFLTNHWHTYMESIANYGARFDRMNISIGDFYKMPLPSPTLLEQTKIANFLTAIDKRLQALQQKKKLLEQYKKGLMQKIFSQELRFKKDDGSDFPDWEEKTLGEVAKFSKGKGISKKDIDSNGILECIRYGELYTHYKETIKEIISKTNISSKELILSEYNDIIIPSSGETQIDIATASCVLKSGVALGGDLNIIKTKQDGVFLAYYLNNAKKQEIATLAQGISVVHLYSSQLRLLKFMLPCVNEQQKIANFLSTIDDKINKVTQQIEFTQTYKKGLLQQMFC